MNKLVRTRALAVKGSQVGKARYNLYKKAFSRINESIEKGFYLEAITLIESVVSDRLESRLSYLFDKDISFKTLGELTKLCNSRETDSELKLLVVDKLDNWRKARNEALHEMAKLYDGDNLNWDDRAAKLPKVATDGLRILRAINAKCKKLRKTS